MACRTFATSTGRLTPETDQASRARSALLSVSLLPQRIAPRHSCFRGAGCFPPGLFDQECGRHKNKGGS
jgi:hypothetical protein